MWQWLMQPWYNEPESSLPPESERFIETIHPGQPKRLDVIVLWVIAAIYPIVALFHLIFKDGAQ